MYSNLLNKDTKRTHPDVHKYIGTNGVMLGIAGTK